MTQSSSLRVHLPACRQLLNERGQNPRDAVEKFKNVFVLKTVPDADRLRSALDEMTATKGTGGERVRAAVLGGGFIGIETAEALFHRGCDVTLVEANTHVVPGFDEDMARFVHHHVLASGMKLKLGSAVAEFARESQPGGTNVTSLRFEDCSELDTDVLILAVGVEPEVSLGVQSGLPVGETGLFKVDDEMRSIADSSIFCVGDAVEKTNRVTGKPGKFQLAGPAQKQGRVAGTNAALQLDTASRREKRGRAHDSGREAMRYAGALGTSIVDVLGCVAACTGITEAECKSAGIAYDVAVTHPLSHVSYVQGAKFMHIKMIVEQGTCRVLGAQIVGVEGSGVARRIDVIATAIAGSLTCEDLEGLDLAYAPFHGAANDPIAVAGFVAADAFRGDVRTVSSMQYRKDFVNPQREHFLLDVRDPPEFAARQLRGAVNIPLMEMRERLDEIPKDVPIITTCRVGLTAYVAARALSNLGYDDVAVLAGGITSAHARVHPDDPSYFADQDL